jgi:hypothetical protein
MSENSPATLKRLHHQVARENRKYINLSYDEREDVIMEEDDVVQLGEDLYEEREEEKDLEEEPGNRVPLKGCQLGGARASEEYSADFAKARFEGTPRILFIPNGASSEQALTPLKRSTRPTPSSQEFSPLLPPNLPKRRKGTRINIKPITLMFPPLDDSEAMHVPSQASVSAEDNPGQGNLNSLMKEMFVEFKTSQKEKVQTIID